MSRPRLSVPMRCTISGLPPSAARMVSKNLGSLLRTAGLIAFGSIVPSEGAARLIASMKTSTAAPATTAGFQTRLRCTALRASDAPPTASGTSSTGGPTLIGSVTDARIDHGVEDVDQQVH